MSVRFVYPLARQAEVDSMLKDMKERGVIEESVSVSSSPFVILRNIFESVSRAKHAGKNGCFPLLRMEDTMNTHAWAK
jgi:hypothetical protein